MVQKNYDPSTVLCWYRKLYQHPDSSARSLAEAFCALVASWLGMDHAPVIFWFEEVDFIEAKEAWLASPHVKRSPSEDPLKEPCDYFRWGGRPGARFVGYTHRESPLGIMINICRTGTDLLDTIAEECFHLHQDFIHGPGWRAEAGYDAVEGEAREFVCSKAGETQAFLEDWSKDRRLDSDDRNSTQSN